MANPAQPLPAEKLGATYPAIKRIVLGGRDIAGDFLKMFGDNPRLKTLQGQYAIGKDQLVRPIDDLIGGHVTLLTTLRAQPASEHITHLSNAYEALGARLPELGLVSNIKRAMGRVLHVDHGGTDVAMSKINDACKYLSSDYHRTAYEAAVKKDPRFMNEMFEKALGSKHVPQYRDPITNPSQLITGPKHAEPLLGTKKALNNKPLVFGAVAAVALAAVGGYALWRHLESKRDERVPAPAR